MLLLTSYAMSIFIFIAKRNYTYEEFLLHLGYTITIESTDTGQYKVFF